MLSSPYYPANYDNNDICVWNITAEENYTISLKFENFDVSKTVTNSNKHIGIKILFLKYQSEIIQ